MPSVVADITRIPASTKVNGVSLKLSEAEAQMLRRVCYYNLTVADKFAGNPKGGHRKSNDIRAFMGSLGNSLKAQGIDRY